MTNPTDMKKFFFFPFDEDSFMYPLDNRLPDLVEETTQHAQSFRRNLNAVVSTVSVPFLMALASVQGRRFALLHAAERIRALKEVEAGESLSEELEIDAYRKASARMSDEIRDANKSVLEILAELAQLRENSQSFPVAADELLRQGVVLLWGALEVLAGDLFVALINKKPILSVHIMKHDNAKKLFKDFKGLPLDILEEYNFDISHNMGDVIIDYHDVDSIPTMKTVFGALFPENIELQTKLAVHELYILNQSRHLIVHKRGVVDKEYSSLVNTLEVGTELRVSPTELEKYLEVVRDVGIEIIIACNTAIKNAS